MSSKRKGITLIELLIASVIGSTIYFSMASLLYTQGKQDRRNQQFVNTQVEHQAFRNVIHSLTSTSLIAILCGVPHPWAAYDPATNQCIAGKDKTNTPYPPPTAAEVTNFKNLGDAAYAWALNRNVAGGRLSPVLDQNDFDTNVKPLIQATNCRSCHDGTGAGPIMDRDITVYNDIVRSPPLMSTMPLTSPLGRALIRSKWTFLSFQVGKEDVSHEVQFSVPSACAIANLVPPVPRIFITGGAKPTCPGGKGTSGCNAGEYPYNCIVTCSASGGGGSSGGGGGCTQWTRKVSCYLPTIYCTDPLACNPGLSPIGCLENQNSVACGIASTKWLCVDLVAGINPILKVNYTVTSSYQDLVEDQAINIASDGTLP